MNSKVKIIIGIGVFIIFICIAVFAYNKLINTVTPQNNFDIAESQNTVPDESTESEKEKVKASDFTVLDSDGNSVMLSDLEGKPVIVNFWASWCPPCRSEMPEFNKVYEEVGEDVIFMMIDLVDGQRETMETGKEYIAEQGFSFPVYYDTEQDAAYTYGIMSIPTTLFIDKNGYISTRVQGGIDEETLRECIDLIIETD